MHSEVGAFLMGLWGMSDRIVEALAFHHNPGHCPALGFSPLTAVHAANALDHESCRRIVREKRLNSWTWNTLENIKLVGPCFRMAVHFAIGCFRRKRTMNDKVLLVDDDQNLLSAAKRHLRKTIYRFQQRFGRRMEGLKLIEREGPFSVIVSDLRMPGMDGIQFLLRVRETAPDTVRMMLTGNADLQSAVAAVNDGQVFQFLTKPCHQEITRPKRFPLGIKQYRLVTAERELLEKTLRGSILILDGHAFDTESGSPGPIFQNQAACERIGETFEPPAIDGPSRQRPCFPRSDSSFCLRKL